MQSVEEEVSVEEFFYKTLPMPSLALIYKRNRNLSGQSKTTLDVIDMHIIIIDIKTAATQIGQYEVESVCSSTPSVCSGRTSAFDVMIQLISTTASSENK